MKNTMKNLAAVILAALTFGLTSCTKDAEDLIIGSWDVTSYISSSTISGLTGEMDQENGTWCDTITPDAGESATLTFAKDGTLTITETDEGRTTSTGNYTYTISDNKLTLVYTFHDGETDASTYTIDNITKKEMTLSENESGTDIWNDQTYNYDYSLKINLKKK